MHCTFFLLPQAAFLSHAFFKMYLADLFVMVKATYCCKVLCTERGGVCRVWEKRREKALEKGAAAGKESRGRRRRRHRWGEAAVSSQTSEGRRKKKCNWWRAVLPLYSGAAYLVCGNLLWRDGQVKSCCTVPRLPVVANYVFIQKVRRKFSEMRGDIFSPSAVSRFCCCESAILVAFFHDAIRTFGHAKCIPFVIAACVTLCLLRSWKMPSEEGGFPLRFDLCHVAASIKEGGQKGH